MSAGKGKGTSQGTKGGQVKGSFGQRNPHSGRGASVHQVAGSDEDYYNNLTTEGEHAPMHKGIYANKLWETSVRMRTVPGKVCSRNAREIIRNRGAKVLWPPHTQSGVFLNVRSWTLERCL